MAREILTLMLLVGWMLLTPAVATAGYDDDLFGGLNSAQQQQSTGSDDVGFLRLLNQEFTDFFDPSRHQQPCRSRTRSYQGPYSFYDTDFDGFWDVASNRSQEAQGPAGAVVAEMFKDVVSFDPNQSSSAFMLSSFFGVATRGCSQAQLALPRTRYGKGTASTQDGLTLNPNDASSPDFNFDLGSGDNPAGASSTDFSNPVLSTDPLVFRSDRYVVGGYAGLSDFSSNNSGLVQGFLSTAAQNAGYPQLYDAGYLPGDEGSTYSQIKRFLQARKLPVLALLPRTREAVLIYRVVERSDGVGAMMFWRPSDVGSQNSAASALAQNLIWAVPTDSGAYRFSDRGTLNGSQLSWGNHATVVMVPNLCGVYTAFANGLQGTQTADPGFSPPSYWGKGKDDGGAPPIFNQPDPSQWQPDPSQGVITMPPQNQVPVPPAVMVPPTPVYRDPGMNSDFNWGINLLFGGDTGSSVGINLNNNPGYWGPAQPVAPPIQIVPPPYYQQPMPPPYYQQPYPPMLPPNPFTLRPPVKNPYVDKPAGTGRGTWIKIGYGFDQTGFNQYGYDLSGLDHSGFDPWGYDAQGYGNDGFDPWGYDRGGYNRAGFPLSNRSPQLLSLVQQFHQNPLAFRMQFDLQADGSIVRIIDGAVVWNNAGANTGATGTPPLGKMPTPVAPPIPGVPVTPSNVPVFTATTIKGHITGVNPPYEVDVDQNNKYSILINGKRIDIPRNINVNSDFQMSLQPKTNDYVFVQSTPATK